MFSIIPHLRSFFLTYLQFLQLLPLWHSFLILIPPVLDASEMVNSPLAYESQSGTVLAMGSEQHRGGMTTSFILDPVPTNEAQE